MEESRTSDSPRTAAPAPLSTNDTIRLVLVDDNDALRRMLRRAIRDFKDLEVVGEASNGHEAIEVVKKTRPHAVVMDLRMPEMDGVEATKAIKADFPGVVVVAFSSDGSLRDAVIKADASGFILKGERMRDLIERIRQLVATRESVLHDVLPPRVAEFVQSVSGPVAVTQRRLDDSEAMPVIVYVSDAMAHVYGYDVEDIVGKGYEFWLSLGINLDEWTESVDQLRSGQQFETEFTARRKNGSRIKVHVKLLPFVSETSFDVVSILQPIPASDTDAPLLNNPDEPDYPPETPMDLREELDRNPKARKRFLTMSSEERREVLAYIEAEGGGRRDARIMNIVMSLDY